MTTKPLTTTSVLLIAALLLTPAGVIAEQEASSCVELGALAWDDWTRAAAGGSGMPMLETERDYLRCASCHGWDRLGKDGGYVRRLRTAGQPNAGFGDSDTSSRNINPGFGDAAAVSPEQILHHNTGRGFSQGSASWVPLDETHSAANKTAHALGYTLGNQHPDFSTDGANDGDLVLSQEQVECLAQFINFAPANPYNYFQAINTRLEPVLYTVDQGANSAAGGIYYAAHCENCHGDPAVDHQGGNNGQPEGGILTFLERDGAFSEFAHKVRWGIPDTNMTRSATGTPDSQDIVDLMQYLQGIGGTGFAITGGISGTWFSAARDGEGFLIDVAPVPQGWNFVVSYFTYDGDGNQLWLGGSGLSDGNRAVANMELTAGGVFGSAFDKDDVERYQWGELEFVMDNCSTGHVWIRPNEAMLASGMGFESFHYQIRRLTQAGTCP